MVDWSKVPDVAAVALLTCAFATVARRGHTSMSRPWLTGWIMIVIHFAAFLFSPLPGEGGKFAIFIGLAALTWAGVLFMQAALPYRREPSTGWMLLGLLGAYTFYFGVAMFAPSNITALNAAAACFAVVPISVAVLSVRRINHPLRWILVALHALLADFLLAFQQRPGNGIDLASNAVLFTVYFGCCISFCWAYRKVTTGAFITIAGFLAWASVFVVAPSMQAFLPSVHLESEVWNLPKYVVAVGMILFILEEQIEHNMHLALHDDLTGLPNRRLFQDRLAFALERARRSESHAALLLIDLDRFKQVNDTVGHYIGDLVLMRASQLFAARVRRSDTVARTGGDEFSIILEGPTSREEAEQVSRSLIHLLNQPLQLENHEVRVGASVGIAMFPEDGPTCEALRIAAELRMYEQKYQARAAARPLPSPLTIVEVATGV